MNIWCASLCFLHLCRFGITSDVVNYFPVESQPTATFSCFYPLQKKRVLFGLKYIRQVGSFLICPRIIFSSKDEVAEGHNNLQLYFCLDHYGITLNNAAEILREEEGVTVAENKYVTLWFEVNSSNGTIAFGHQHNPVPIFQYNVRSHFNETFITHFGFAGSGQWLLESEKQYLIADTQDSGRSTTYFPLNTRKINFAVQPTANFTWCPRIILSNKVDSYNDIVNLGVIFCPSSIGLITRGINTTIVANQNSLIYDSLKPYTLLVDKVDGILSLEDYGIKKSIFIYDISDYFDDFFIDYFALAGSGHWIINFTLDIEDFEENLSAYLTLKSNSTITDT